MKMERAKSIEELRIELRRKSLECPVCWEIPKTGPLYQCENGHFLCSACNGKVNLCPVCRVNLPKVRIRNLFFLNSFCTTLSISAITVPK